MKYGSSPVKISRLSFKGIPRYVIMEKKARGSNYMKKRYLIAVLLLIALGLAGCAMVAGISLEVNPNPLIFTSGTDLIQGTVTASTTGLGELRIDSFSVMVTGTKEGKTLELFAIDSADLNFEPVAVPFAVEGFSEEFDLQELLCDQFNQETFTVQDLIELIPGEFGITSYDDLALMDSLDLTFTVVGNETVSEEVGFIFQ